jgi:uncharacterized protein YrrD
MISLSNYKCNDTISQVLIAPTGQIHSCLAIQMGWFHQLLQFEYNIFTRTYTCHQIISHENYNCIGTVSQIMVAPTGQIHSGLAIQMGWFHQLLQFKYNIFTRTCTCHQIISHENYNCIGTVSQIMVAPAGQIHSGLAIQMGWFHQLLQFE